MPSKPTEARPPYIIDETNVKTKQQVSSEFTFLESHGIQFQPLGTLSGKFRV